MAASEGATPLIKPRIFRGTRDFLPHEMTHRERIVDTMRGVFRKYGFAPLETPAIEYLEVLSGKYGEDADRLIYRLNYKTGTKDEAALHYDLTVPLSRVIAMHRQELVYPFKRYQIQPVWRADNPQPRQGRFREFYQCDVDAVGSRSLMLDAEIVAVVFESLAELGFEGFLIKLNSRRVLNALVQYIGLDGGWTGEVCRSIDKLDKISFAEVAGELRDKDIPPEALTRLEGLLRRGEVRGAAALDTLTPQLESVPGGAEGLAEVRTLLAYLGEMGVPPEALTFDLTLARGLDYYTGPIFETTLPAHPHIGSLSGGGRYDELIGMFSGVELPAVGTSLGLDRIFSAMQQLEMLPAATTHTRVLITLFDAQEGPAMLRQATELRAAGIPTEVMPEPLKLKQQFSYANRKGIPFVLVIGEDERQAGTVTLKDMARGEQTTLPQTELIAHLLGQ